MSEPQEGCVFKLDAGLTLARLLCEGEVSSEFFDRLSSCAQRLARAGFTGVVTRKCSCRRRGSSRRSGITFMSRRHE